MTDSLDVQIPWPDWRAVKRLGRGSYGSVWEIERNASQGSWRDARSR